MPGVSGNFSSIYGGDTGISTIVCDGNGGYEPVLNLNADAPCGIDQCATEHEDSHAADWSAQYPDGCVGQPEGGDIPTSGPGYDAFLNQSECKAYGTELACDERLFEQASPECQPIIQERMEQILPQDENACQADYP